jgi:hypothetical protein
LFDPGLLQPGYLASDFGNFRSEPPELIEVRSEDFHGDLGRHAAEHVADPVGERAADGAESPRDSLHRGTNVGEDLLAISFRRLGELDVELDRRNGDDVVAALGSPGPVSDRFDLRDLEKEIDRGVGEGGGLG